MDKRELAAFLRRHRERIAPATAGLPAGGLRRTPGLRREEVAQLAHISTEYYTRLEQARGPRPSRDVLAAISRALRLTDPERLHLFALAGEQPGRDPGPPNEVPASVLDLIQRLPLTAAIVLDAKYDVLAWNPLAAALLEDFSAQPRRDRNVIRRYFLGPDPERRFYDLHGEGGFGRYAAGRLRAALARYPGDRATRDLVRDLLAGSAEFAALWDRGDIPDNRNQVKTVHHPQVGRITLTCDILTVPDLDQDVVLFTATPGTPDHQALQLLAVIGLQRLDAPG